MYNSQDIATKIKSVAKTKKISIKQLLQDINLGFNTMSNMKTSMPKADNLAKIADYLDCSVDYLLGRTDNPDVQTHSSSNITNKAVGINNTANVVVNDKEVNNKDISKQALELAKIFDNLDIRNQAEILATVLGIEAQNSKK